MKSCSHRTKHCEGVLHKRCTEGVATTHASDVRCMFVAWKATATILSGVGTTHASNVCAWCSYATNRFPSFWHRGAGGSQCVCWDMGRTASHVDKPFINGLARRCFRSSMPLGLHGVRVTDSTWWHPPLWPAIAGSGRSKKTAECGDGVRVARAARVTMIRSMRYIRTAQLCS